MIKRKKGDTLVEVMLAVGIFSLVAIVVTSVVSGSTSSAQTALEATLTREEVDAQAEALRFIHAAYISNPEGNFKTIWEEAITGKENVVSGNASIDDELGDYPPVSCNAIYSGSEDDLIVVKKAFVIDPRALGLLTQSDLTSGDIDDISYGRIYLSRKHGSQNRFAPASTYPHLVYGDEFSNTNTEGWLDDASSTLYRAEGIYDIAVAGPNYGVPAVPQYYDFYIRTCWYGTGDRNASTISTVIRLYNPAVMLSTGS